MRSDLFNFIVPPERIAQVPADRRDASKLLVVRRAAGTIEHHVFKDLPKLLNPGDLLLANNTRVKPCRLHCRKEGTGGHVELFLLRQIEPNPKSKTQNPKSTPYEALTGSWSNLKPGQRLELPQGGGTATLIERRPNRHWQVTLDMPADEADAYVRRAAKMPLPPYIKREREADAHASLDLERYQTVFAEHEGAVAAPTAALHFTPQVLQACEARRISRAMLTLHVGPGTFQPLKAATLEEHEMHAEEYSVPQSACDAVRETRARGGRVVVVGTTSCRTAETVADERGLLRAGSGETRLFIYPPWRFRCTDALLTNFHLPNSTLIFLVAAWLGMDLTRQAYDAALAEDYRFFSYGDAMLCLP